MSEAEMETHDDAQESNDIAIVGMACRVPGAENTQQFWNMLKAGNEALTELSDEELLAAGVSERELEDPNYVKAGMFLKHMECFDGAFFGFNPQEANIMDPQHRHFLECAWEAFENAGYVPDEVEGAVGVFAGSGHNAYMPYNLLPNKDLVKDIGFFLLRHTGNDKDFLSTRVSYLFNLLGPSINVQTACSTSLVAVHSAAQSLLNGECDMALAGGVTIELPHKQGYLYKESEILSKDGHCRPFDASAGGTLFGSGVGCVLLKRMDDALADGDHIHAVLKASAINNDGANKVSYLAPSVDGQAAAIREAIELADIDPASVSFIECHGTGTQLGDPIEVAALTQAYGEENPRKQYCALGSVKSNIGHLDTAAGIAGMIKAILSLQHRQLVPTLHFTAPNEAINFADSPFFVNDRLRDWNAEEPRRAAISSLGVGGTNAHVIIEEAPDFDDAEPSQHARHLFTLSAKSEQALNRAATNLANHLADHPEQDLADVAYTLNVGRKAMDYRLAITARDAAEASAQLADLQGLNAAKGKRVQDEPSLVFMLPGGGAQYSGMGEDLYESESVYREAFDACMACLPAEVSARVRELVFAPESERKQATDTLQTPTLTLTSLFATEYALAKQMMAWGAQPAALVGHSMGENTAACLAGVMSLHDAMNLVYLRGQLFERAPEGGMLSIPMALDDARAYMSEDLDVAAINAEQLCVATGPKQSLLALQEKLANDDVESTIVRINVAAHSRMLDPILEDFRAYLNSITLSPPTIPFTSNLTGTWITQEQATSADYWVDHLRNTVRFAENITTVMEGQSRVLLEIGPGRTLTNLAKANLDASTVVLGSMRHPNEEADDAQVAKQTLGALWSNGVVIDWREYWGEELRFRLPLPTYPFEKKVHWVEAPEGPVFEQETELRKKKNLDDWFARLSWQQSELPAKAVKESEQAADVVIFDTGSALGDAIQAQLKTEQLSCTRVNPGQAFAKVADQHFQMAINNERDYFALSEQCLEASDKPLKIIYLWTVLDGQAVSEAHVAQRSFWALFNLMKVLAELDRPVELCVVSDALYSLAGESIQPDASLALGPVLVAPRELPHVNARIVDVREPQQRADLLARQLLAEVCQPSEHTQVLYRGRSRWVRTIQDSAVAKRQPNENWLPEDASVFISGGLGGIGLNLAKRFCEKGAKRIVLLSRRELPEPASWESTLSTLLKGDPQYFVLSRLLELSKSGVEIITLAADVCDAQSMQSALASKGLSPNDFKVVIHAAGVMDDKLLLEKTTDEAARVLAAKVNGAKALDSLFASAELDYFVVFSSVASYLGLPGQIDYTAANAFLDAFAQARNEQRPGKSLVVNWSAWKEVGMAANAMGEQSEAEPVKASFIEQVRAVADGAIYSLRLDAQNDWLVNEHQTRDGFHLLPGTGFIELIRAACSHYLSGETRGLPLHMKELSFLSAFEVPQAGSRVLNMRLERMVDGLGVSVYAEDEDFPMATAQVSKADLPAQQGDIAAIQSRCNESKPNPNKQMDQVFMAFGPRWSCIEAIKANDKEALVQCSLPEVYADDFESCQLHPAMLDMATGCAQFLKAGFNKEQDFYVPVEYEAMDILAAMPAQFYSHVRLLEAPSEDQIAFDVDMMDGQGQVFARVHQFTMQKLAHGFATTLNESHTADEDEGMTPEEERLAAIMREAIAPEEGVAAFDKLLSVLGEESQAIIASIDTALWQEQLRTQFGGEPEAVDAGPEEPQHDADADPDIPKVEGILGEHKGVEQAVVRSFMDEAGERRIIAYYVPDEWEQVTVTELRNDLMAALPQELMPQQLVQMDEFAQDESGGIDRSQLRDPFAPVDHYIAPRTATEKRLEKIWQGVLGVSRVSLDENFFDIGGHSLLSIRVIVKVKKEFGVRLDQAKMVLLTLEQMAKDIDDQRQPAGEGEPSATVAPAEPQAQPPTETASQAESAAGERKKGLLSSLFKKKKA